MAWLCQMQPLRCPLAQGKRRSNKRRSLTQELPAQFPMRLEGSANTPDYSGLIPARLTTLLHFSVSAAT
jgi:hypothetical protein